MITKKGNNLERLYRWLPQAGIMKKAWMHSYRGILNTEAKHTSFIRKIQP